MTYSVLCATVLMVTNYVKISLSLGPGSCFFYRFKEAVHAWEPGHGAPHQAVGAAQPGHPPAQNYSQGRHPPAQDHPQGRHPPAQDHPED